jgi:hypothetical protein
VSSLCKYFEFANRRRTFSSSTNVEQSSDNARYVDGTNTEINEDIYTVQELRNNTLIVKLQQEVLRGNAEGNNAVMMMKKRKTFKKSPTKQMLMRKISVKDMLIIIIGSFFVCAEDKNT